MWIGKLALAAVLIAGGGVGAPPPAEAAPATAWRVELTSVGGDVAGVVAEDGALRLREARRSALGDGVWTFGVRRLGHNVDAVEASADGDGVEIEVRVRRPGDGWSEWRTATPRATLPLRGNEVQSRAIFTGAGAELRDLRLRAWDTGRALAEAERTPLTYRLYATREGLVGHTTANGHTIRENDRFVALPSRRALSSKGGREYTVTLKYRGRTATAPVWDVGPWNTKDDYWNPSDQRERFRDLPQGTPEAQAAYQDGYNDGKDGFGRTVRNPAGIDIADGTFWHDLKMKDNDWVEVTFNWTDGGDDAWSTVMDDSSEENFTASDAWGASSRSRLRYGVGYRHASPSAVDDPAWFRTTVPEAGDYDVSVWYPSWSGYNAATRYLIRTTSGIEMVPVDQRTSGGEWLSLGVFPLPKGLADVVGVSPLTPHPGVVVADAIRLTRTSL